jgi:hypothetical protein
MSQTQTGLTRETTNDRSPGMFTVSLKKSTTELLKLSVIGELRSLQRQSVKIAKKLHKRLKPTEDGWCL